jgi:hypothetical protein
MSIMSVQHCSQPAMSKEIEAIVYVLYIKFMDFINATHSLEKGNSFLHSTTLRHSVEGIRMYNASDD